MHLSFIFYFDSSRLSRGEAKIHPQQRTTFHGGRKMFVKFRQDFEPNLKSPIYLIFYFLKNDDLVQLNHMMFSL